MINFPSCRKAWSFSYSSCRFFLLYNCVWMTYNKRIRSKHCFARPVMKVLREVITANLSSRLALFLWQSFYPFSNGHEVEVTKNLLLPRGSLVLLYMCTFVHAVSVRFGSPNSWDDFLVYFLSLLRHELRTLLLACLIFACFLKFANYIRILLEPNNLNWIFC